MAAFFSPFYILCSVRFDIFETLPRITLRWNDDISDKNSLLIVFNSERLSTTVWVTCGNMTSRGRIEPFAFKISLLIYLC